MAEPEYMPSRHRNEDIRYISTPDMWEMWPFCPLKRAIRQGNGFVTREFGYLFADGKGLQIRDGNVWCPKDTDPIKLTYATVQDLVNDGWEVD